jgi:choline dehydrogenase-like flavoprotein
MPNQAEVNNSKFAYDLPESSVTTSLGTLIRQQQKNEMDTTVIVCTCNRCQAPPKTLESLAASKVPDSIEWEVLVVDSNSTDQIREVVEGFCRRHPGRFRYVFEPHPGESHALNAGIRESRGEILPFVDDDVTVESTWLQNLAAPMKEIFGHRAGLASVGEMLAHERNQVTLGPEVKDIYGLPVPLIKAAYSQNELAMIEAISSKQREISQAAGAQEIQVEDCILGCSSHYVSTCRMGKDPKTSVVDPWCRTHDVPICSSETVACSLRERH